MLDHRFARSRWRSFAAALVILASAGHAFAHGDDQHAPTSKSAPLTTGTPPASDAARDAAYTLFEAGQVRPLALSPNGRLLFAANTPDNRMEVFRVGPQGALKHSASVSVGMEPVAIAARDDNEVWVVNRLSDSVSIVHLDDDGDKARVVRTLLVGDEPSDIVFAGHHRSRAFITTAHRGQNSPLDPESFDPSVGRADVWVFDTDTLGDHAGGTALSILTLFTDTPRALAATPDGKYVYAAGFNTGNKTATIFSIFLPPGTTQVPPVNHEGIPAPSPAKMVRWDGQHWTDPEGVVWDDQMRFSLRDSDIFKIDATANPPAQVAGDTGSYSGVGTVLYNMIVNPVSGALYVSNLDSRNFDKFEGPGTFAGHSLRGHSVESHVTVVKNGQVTPRHLNKHIDYSTCCAPIPNDENSKSLASPTDMQISSDGKTLYIAALGSSKVGVFSTKTLEDDTFVPSTSAQIAVTGGGPTGLALDESHHRLYVLTRFDNSISIVDTTQKQEIGKVAMHNPEPQVVTRGRRFLYDAAATSSHGDTSCASCHIFADKDDLAWDLGDPDADVVLDPNPEVVFGGGAIVPSVQEIPIFHPMKGPMSTQSLRGMANHGPMHWRGDRTNGAAGPAVQPDGGAYDEEAAFKKFQVAFTDLLGRDSQIADEDMQAFTDFSLRLTYPPNPIRNLDNSLTADQSAGEQIFNTPSILGNSCQNCHRLDPYANEGLVAKPGFFGSGGNEAFVFQDQMFKVAHFRNLYSKVGRFGQPANPFLVDSDTGWLGDQVRGFGFTHDGGFDTLFHFDGLAVGVFPEPQDVSRQHLEEFLMAFPSNLAPIVGQQITLGNANGGASTRIDLMIARASEGECEVIAKSVHGGREHGYLYEGAGVWETDDSDEPTTSDAHLRQAANSGSPVTFTCVPPGSGVRMGIDRDLDGAYDGDEIEAGSDPADPDSLPQPHHHHDH